MLLALIHPEMIAGAVLHDIGPVIEPQGVARIKSYVGKLRLPQNLQEGAEALRELFGTQFPKLTAAQWLRAAERTWNVQAGKLVQTYDPALAESRLISTSNTRYRHCGTSSMRSLACRSW
jgi:hypothetical protein